MFDVKNPRHSEQISQSAPWHFVKSRFYWSLVTKLKLSKRATGSICKVFKLSIRYETSFATLDYLSAFSCSKVKDKPGSEWQLLQEIIQPPTRLSPHVANIRK